MLENPAHLKLLEDWMRSYKPEELFDAGGALRPELKALAPKGTRRMSANLHANGGLLRKDLSLPDFRDYAVKVPQAGKVMYENTKPLGEFLRDILRRNPTSFRVFGPDETASNRLQAVYEASKKTWLADMLPEDADGGELARDGRVMEMLSEHTLIGWLEGYLLTGRHGFFHTYEAFAHVIDSMFNQHAKWLDISKNHVKWRAAVASENILLSSTVWRQDAQRLLASGPRIHRSGHQQKRERHARVSAARCQHAAGDGGSLPALDRLHQRHRLRQTEAPAVHHDRRGDRPLREGLRNLDAGQQRPGHHARCRDGLVRRRRNPGGARGHGNFRQRGHARRCASSTWWILFKLQPAKEHPHGSTDAEFDSVFGGTDTPIIFNFHGYPWLIHKLAYRFRGDRPPARARLQGERQHQYAVLEAGAAQRNLAVSPRSSMRSTGCRRCGSRPRTCARR